MNRRTTTIAILLLLGIGIGTTASFLVSTINQNTWKATQQDNVLENPGTTTDTLRDTESEIKYLGPSQVSVPKNIAAITLSESRYERRAEMSAWILALDEKRLVAWLEESISINWDVSSNARTDFQGILLTKLTSFNPVEAIDFTVARSEPARSELVRTVCFEWAIADLDAAVEHASNIENELRRVALQGILEATDSRSLDEHRVIAKRLGDEAYATTYHIQKFLDGATENPEEIWFQAVVLADLDHEHYHVLSQLASSWIEASGIDVLEEIIASMTDIEMRAAVTKAILVEVAHSMPDQAFNFALTLAADNREYITRNVVEVWAKQDPHVALEAVKIVPPGQFRSDLEFSAVLQWVHNDPRDVLVQVPELPVSTRESAVTEAIYLIAEEEPTEAASLVGQVDDALQWKARDILLESWISQDFEAAIDWVENSKSIKPVDRPYVLHDLANKAFWIDPNRAFQIARQVSLLGESTVGTEAMIIGRIANSDLKLALELLPEVRAGDTKTQSYVSVASTLIEQGDTQEALNLGAQLPESDQNDFLFDLAQRWGSRDITSLLAQMDSFPTSEVQSKIALSLIRINRKYPRFTDSQIEQLESHLSTEDKTSLENSSQ
ncbi:MAG: hypothetical protein F4Z01_01280 [Gammaproteobacteria bacterium]|nr:hypothetical protein [Gammaproteobacteria bacterium]MYF37261.1 hypothetical protein [Gammaproteobacteria bacterium]